jgi:phosphatidylglycerol:prolipoprotein diacylglycerol transferase
MHTHGSIWYAALTGVGLIVASIVAVRVARGSHEPADGRLAVIWFAAMGGALLGAHLVYGVAEGWASGSGWRAILGGRSILGGLLGGYLAVELAKRLVGWPTATGDIFAVTVPLALAIGRVGCIMAGCCQGMPCGDAWYAVSDGQGGHRWPAAQWELGFNLAFCAWAIVAGRRGWLAGQRFHVYLIAYGLFRFAHAFLRDDPRWIGPVPSSVGGYHVAALLCLGLGTVRYLQRRGAPGSAGAPLGSTS